jgi:hypothetical protein
LAVDISRIAFATREYRSVTTQDLSVQTKHPLATELEFSSFLANVNDATTFGTYILNLRKVDRYNWYMRIARENANFTIGDTITVTYPRYGLSAGKNFIVKRIRNDLNNPWLEVALFGPET